MTLAPHRIYTIEEYVQLEKFSNVKHEFYAGQIWAMSGGTPDHSAFAVNIATSPECTATRGTATKRLASTRIPTSASCVGTSKPTTMIALRSSIRS